MLWAYRIHPLSYPFITSDKEGAETFNAKEYLYHLWVMSPESGIVVIAVAALAAPFHLSKAGIGGKYSRRLSLEPESTYPSWHLSLAELGTVFSNHFSTKQKACLTSLRIQCQVCGSSRRGRGTTTCRKKKMKKMFLAYGGWGRRENKGFHSNIPWR